MWGRGRVLSPLLPAPLAVSWWAGGRGARGKRAQASRRGAGRRVHGRRAPLRVAQGVRSTCSRGRSNVGFRVRGARFIARGGRPVSCALPGEQLVLAHAHSSTQHARGSSHQGAADARLPPAGGRPTHHGSPRGPSSRGLHPDHHTTPTRTRAAAHRRSHTVVVTCPVGAPPTHPMPRRVTLACPAGTRSVRRGGAPGTYAGDDSVGTLPSVV